MSRTRKTARLFLSLVLAAGLATSSLAVADPPALGLVLQRTEGKLLVGVTADHKLVLYDLSDPAAPVKRAERDLGGPVADLKLVDGVVFVAAVRTEVATFSVGAGRIEPWLPGAVAAAQPSAPAAAASAKVLLGKVSTVSRGTALLELDEGTALRPGDAVLVRSQRAEQRMNLLTGKEEAVVSNAPVAVLEVRQVQGQKAVAELARGDEVAPGDTIERTERSPRGVAVFAPRSGYDTWARGIVRLFPNFGDLDVGALVELSGGFYYDWLHVQARLSPIGISVPQAVHAYNAQVLVSYQNDLAEFGLGTGYFSHQFEGESSWDCTNSGYVAKASSDSSGGTQVQKYNCSQQGPTVAQVLRLGAVDGLHLRLTNTLAIDDGKFRFGYLDGSLDVPLSRNLNLYAAGGGSTGIAWGEGGMRTYLRGVGGRDTLILTTGVGGTSIRTVELYGGTKTSYDAGGGQTVEYWNDRQRSVGGLHIAVGLEWRH
ncbi:MAG: hypothetical protein HY902_11120 [Deltaproteobacteria bacterium]|nr:hypothetical protein [Deltaproteobacteria bacterium]